MARHIYQATLRWSDMDAYRHINNVQYLRYLEEARVDMMFTLGQREGAKTLSEGVVIARHEIDYKRPLVWRAEPVRVETWVTRIGAARFTLAYEIKDDEQVYATALSVLVPYSLDEQRPRRLTEDERAYLERFVEPQDEPAGRPVRP
ncbi:acyl-CoA thioesterase [Embleya scabrispora]|uniref:acyl-CoA thioesterase n=1 Tax=Embleya scabrispora TaxID=159449 RepID=UPI000372272F|nr:thioesterase family protein [Embleya scabrispora]MYS82455.1 acyl-CoA thioesterase [Streptomyces sp. SID5474]